MMRSIAAAPGTRLRWNERKYRPVAAEGCIQGGVAAGPVRAAHGEGKGGVWFEGRLLFEALPAPFEAHPAELLEVVSLLVVDRRRSRPSLPAQCKRGEIWGSRRDGSEPGLGWVGGNHSGIPAASYLSLAQPKAAATNVLSRRHRDLPNARLKHRTTSRTPNLPASTLNAKHPAFEMRLLQRRILISCACLASISSRVCFLGERLPKGLSL